MNRPDWAFFGTDEFAVVALEQLKTHNLVPALIVTAPDKPKGRRFVLTPSPVKIWAETNNITVTTPAKLSDPEFPNYLKAKNCQLYVVASYGKIIPKAILDLPERGTLNIHPSLLPRHRGPSPLEYQILSGDSETGVTIILVDEKVDHGPIIAQNKVDLPLATIYYADLREALAKAGADLLAESMSGWLEGEIEAVPQIHDSATFTQKIKKEDGALDLTQNALLNFRKIRAFTDWPGTYFFANNKRIKITQAHLEGGELILDRVIPEGKHEMSWADYARNL